VEKPCKFTPVSLFPFVEEVYRHFFWDDRYTYIFERHWEIMLVCSDPKTTADVRGHLFKDIVTAGLVTKGLSSDDLQKILASANVTTDDDWVAKPKYCVLKIQLPVHDSKFPSSVYWSDPTPYYFTPMGFKIVPGVDLMLCVRKIVMIFSFHMSDDHDDVTPTVMDEAVKARWNKDQVERIIVVYLSPNEDTRRKLEKKIGRMTPSPQVDYDWIVTRFHSFHEFRSFQSLPWSD
jgi:hypothetical protein